MTPDHDPSQYTEGLKNIPFYAPAALAVAVSFGQMLLSDDPLTWKKIVGKAVVGGGLGMSAYGLLVWFPNLPPIAVCGIACALSIAGAEGILKLIKERGISLKVGRKDGELELHAEIPHEENEKKE
jgi:hypothetical protein